MTKRYETVFILTPVLSAEQVKETVVKFKKSLKDAGAKLMHSEDWGLKKLAYPIQKKSTGFYHLFEYEMEGEGIADMETKLVILRDSISRCERKKKYNVSNKKAMLYCLV